jgi:hypothetical protein
MKIPHYLNLYSNPHHGPVGDDYAVLVGQQDQHWAAYGVWKAYRAWKPYRQRKMSMNLRSSMCLTLSVSDMEEIGWDEQCWLMSHRS